MAESTKLEDILAQARAIGSQRMSLPQPVKTGSTWKDFVLNALQTAPMGVGAKMSPMATVGSLPKGALLKSDLGAPQVSGGGIAENANVFNPKVNDVLSFLSKENVPIEQIKDTPGGTSYIKANNPNVNNDPIKIRIPNDAHIGTRFTNKQAGNVFDLGTKPTNGSGNRPLITQNKFGEKYGETPGALEDAIKNRFDLHKLIDQHVANMEQPQLTINEMKSQSRFASDPNPVMPERGAQMQAANSVITPRVNDPLLEAMNKTDSGKYQLAIYRQKLKEQGKDPTGMSLMDIYKELNLHLFEDR